MEIHEEFTEWAIGRGVKINGVAAHKFEGRGLGIIATKTHEAKSVLVTVPISALRTVHTIPKTLSKEIGPISVHGLLAADLCLTPLVTGTGPNTLDLRPWRAVLPTMSDFRCSMPILYPSSLQALLPSAAKTLLDNQNRKLKLDWEAVHKAYPELEYAEYLHAWLLINTRTFYFVSPKVKIAPKDRDDCMALNPFADYFNHCSTPPPTTDTNAKKSENPVPCDVAFTTAGYEISTSVPLKRGQEIYISYGPHTNDFLLTEYGFILSSTSSTPNTTDSLPLDAYLLPLFTPTQLTTHLQDANFHGTYTLDAHTHEPCYRTQTALRLLCMPLGKWRRVASGFEEDGERYQDEVNDILCTALKRYLKDARRNLKAVKACEEGLPDQRDILGRRWMQIEVLLQSTIDKIEK